MSARLAEHLRAGKRVLWLVCGGSNILAETKIMQSIPIELLENLTVTLTDERYGPVGHKDSNWQQLSSTGFDFSQVKTLPVLENNELDATVKRYNETIEQAFAENDIAVAVFGIGADGHIAGILPDSPAAQATELAAGYDSPPFVRLTLTFPAIKRIDTAYAFAFGESKREALTKLEAEDIDPIQQPSQILKQLPEAYVYSDQIGGNS